MTVRNIKKNLAGAEDLLHGIGIESQSRGGSIYEMHKLDTYVPTYDVTEMQRSSLTFMRLYGTDTAYTDYRRNPTGTVGIPSDLGGVWEPIRSSELPICGNFTYGAYVFSSDCVVGYNNSFMQWKGALPKVVPAGSTPASTGGIDLGAWVGVDFLQHAALEYFHTSGNSAIENMLAGFPVRSKVGDYCNVSGTLFKHNSGDGTDISHYIVAGDTVSLSLWNLPDYAYGRSELMQMMSLMRDGMTFNVDTNVTVGALANESIDAVGLSNCTFSGSGIIKLADNSQLQNSRAMFYADGLTDCDVMLNFDGNNINNTNDINGSTGLIRAFVGFNCTRTRARNGTCKDANNEAWYFSSGCTDCHIHDNYSVNSFGSDWRLGGSTNVGCTIYNNTARVTRNIHSEKGSGVTGKQDGFAAVKYGAKNARVYGNTGSNLDSSGNQLGVLSTCARYIGMTGTFESFDNKWSGGTSSVSSILSDGSNLDLFKLHDTFYSGVATSSGGMELGVERNATASIKKLDIDIDGETNNTVLAIFDKSQIDKSGNLSVKSGSVRLNAKTLSGNYCLLLKGIGNLVIDVTLDHGGRSHAIQLENSSNSKIGGTINNNGNANRSVNFQDSSGNAVSIVSTNNGGNSVREFGTSDYNNITGCVLNGAISLLGVNSSESGNIIKP